MSTIKPKRGSGSPAGSIETNEIAMDTTSKTLYVSTNGTDAEILANNTEYFLANNTISGITNSAPAYGSILNAIRDDAGGGYSRTAMEVIRDLGSDGALPGKDTRGAMFGFTINSDAGNTNGANTQIFVGGIQGFSGSGNNTQPNWIQAFTYDASFSEYTLWDGTSAEFNIYPPAEFHETVTLDSQASDPTGTNGMMYYNSTSNKFRGYQNGAWINLDGT